MVNGFLAFVRVVLSGGNLNNGSQAGFASRNANNSLGNANSNNGSQLSYFIPKPKQKSLTNK